MDSFADSSASLFTANLKVFIPNILSNQGFNVRLPHQLRFKKFVTWFGLHPARNFSSSKGTRYDPTACGSFFLLDPDSKSPPFRNYDALKSAVEATCTDIGAVASFVSYKGVEWTSFTRRNEDLPTLVPKQFVTLMEDWNSSTPSSRKRRRWPQRRTRTKRPLTR